MIRVETGFREASVSRAVLTCWYTGFGRIEFKRGFMVVSVRNAASPKRLRQTIKGDVLSVDIASALSPQIRGSWCPLSSCGKWWC